MVNDFLRLLGGIDDDALALLESLGKQLHIRRLEALQFKKNAGKFVGNINYRRLPELTVHADFVLLAALGLSGSQAESVLDYVRRVLSINVHAGEKSIPVEVRAQFTPLPFDPAEESLLLRRVRDWAAPRLGLSAERLEQWTTAIAAHDLGIEEE